MKKILALVLALAIASPFLAHADNLVPGDQVVRGNLGVGFDSFENQDFGSTTILLKENNLRIRFNDTSNSGSFPSVDWQLTANDSTSGGRNAFMIDDVTNGRTPFIVETAPDNALYVNSTGNLGLGTDSPMADLHIVDGDSAILRLDQDATGGLTAQTWDLIGNESSLSFRDVTGGNIIPFRIRPSSPPDALTIGVNGVGVGIGEASHRLHVRETGAGQPALIENTNTANAARTVLQLRNQGKAGLVISNTTTSGTASDWELAANDAGELVISNGGGPLFTLDASGNLTVAGAVSDSSDRGRKEDIAPVDGSEILEKLSGLPVGAWSYRGEDVVHIGPMAQDFHAAFGVGATDRAISKVDADGVALASIQALHRASREKDEEIEALKEANRKLEERLERLEALLGASR